MQVGRQCAEPGPGSGRPDLGSTVKQGHWLWPPLRIRARITKKPSSPELTEHVMQLLPVQGGAGFSPGWRCDPDPYLTSPPAEATAALASWTGGLACFWNCSLTPLVRDVEAIVNEEGILSLEDSAGCKTGPLTWISTPIRVVLSCRSRLPDDAGFLRWPQEGEKRDGRSVSDACNATTAARFDWFEFEAAKVQLDPELAQADSKWNWLTRYFVGESSAGPLSLVPPEWRRTVLCGVALLASLLATVQF